MLWYRKEGCVDREAEKHDTEVVVTSEGHANARHGDIGRHRGR
jgi:hypothetical protein